MSRKSTQKQLCKDQSWKNNQVGWHNQNKQNTCLPVGGEQPKYHNDVQSLRSKMKDIKNVNSHAVDWHLGYRVGRSHCFNHISCMSQVNVDAYCWHRSRTSPAGGFRTSRAVTIRRFQVRKARTRALNIGTGICIPIKTFLTGPKGIRNLTDPQKVCLTIGPSTP